jgi:hypothetical protein
MNPRQQRAWAVKLLPATKVTAAVRAALTVIS